MVAETGVTEKKTTGLHQVNDTLYCVMLFRGHFAMSEIITLDVSDDRH
jgi:hypothetical protein